MNSINAKDVMSLRKLTGAGMMACKKALQEAEGNFEDAAVLLRKKGIASAVKKVGRETTNGKIGSYIHTGGKIGSLVKVACETDFVSDTDDFNQLIKDVAMHIVAANPLYLDKDSVPQEAIDKESAIQKDILIASGKPASIIDKILKGKLEKFYKQNCLVEQPFIKNDEETISDLINSVIAKLGENIKIVGFTRFSIDG